VGLHISSSVVSVSRSPLEILGATYVLDASSRGTLKRRKKGEVQKGGKKAANESLGTKKRRGKEMVL